MPLFTRELDSVPLPSGTEVVNRYSGCDADDRFIDVGRHYRTRKAGLAQDTDIVQALGSVLPASGWQPLGSAAPVAVFIAGGLAGCFTKQIDGIGVRLVVWFPVPEPEPPPGTTAGRLFAIDITGSHDGTGGGSPPEC